MSQQKIKNTKPFICIVLLMGFLFGVAFVKMENRRLGYSFVKMLQQEKQLRIGKRAKSLQLVKMTGPARVQFLATHKLPLRKAQTGQIIQMAGNGLTIVR